MDAESLIAALLISGGFVHPYGHVAEGSKRGVPMRVDYESFAEEWEEPENKNDAISIHGAGFKAQDDVARRIDDPKAREAAYLANAILKGTYAMGLPDMIAKGMPKGGDYGKMTELSGNKYTRKTLALSALMDLLNARNPDSNLSMGLEVMPGSTAVGPVFHARW